MNSPSLIRGSTNIYLFAFQMKESLFNTISDLVNIGTVQVPGGELDDVFINFSTLQLCGFPREIVFCHHSVTRAVEEGHLPGTLLKSQVGS